MRGKSVGPRIRLARAEDAHGISLLARDLTARFIACDFSDEAAARLLASMDEPAIRDYMASGYRYHVAEANGEVAGIVAIRDNRHLYHLFVSERFQGKGLARGLWEAARAASLEAGNPGVFTVNSSRHAVGLYEKFGFIRLAEAVDHAGVTCTPMKLELACPMSSSNAQHWNPAQYAENARFVPDLGVPVVELLSPQPGESILDLGCGDGALTRSLLDMGCGVVGVDSSPDMVAAARSLGLNARVADGQQLPFDHTFDAVFSNAALHWMKNPASVIEGVWRALKPGGRFVGELGGYGNVAAIIAALEAALAARGLSVICPWFFPRPETYRTMLETRGFEVRHMVLFPRPTALPGDVGGWLETFAQPYLAAIPASDRKGFVAEVVESLRPALCGSDGHWVADYVRLRFFAAKPESPPSDSRCRQ